jgi:hypothetical protein
VDEFDHLGILVHHGEAPENSLTVHDVYRRPVGKRGDHQLGGFVQKDVEIQGAGKDLERIHEEFQFFLFGPLLRHILVRDHDVRHVTVIIENGNGIRLVPCDLPGLFIDELEQVALRRNPFPRLHARIVLGRYDIPVTVAEFKIMIQVVEG